MQQQTFRNLANYKSSQESVAKEKGCYETFMKAKTLTEARKILYGVKKSNDPVRKSN